MSRVESIKRLFSGRMGRARLALTWIVVRLVIVGSVFGFVQLSEWLDVGRTMGEVMAIPVVAIFVACCIWETRAFILRYHDIGKSGWNVICLAVPILNLFEGVVLFLRRGDDGENAYASTANATAD